MASSVTALNRAYLGVTTTVTHLSMHTGDPGTTGASEVTGGLYEREPVTYDATPAAGLGDITAPVVFNVPSSVTLSHWGAWDDTTFLFGATLTASQPFTDAGFYTLNSAPYDVNSA